MFSFADTAAPDPANPISMLSDAGGAFTVLWNTTGDDGSAGDLAPGYFRLDYSTDPNHPFLNSSVYVVELPTAAAAGSAQSYNFSGLIGNASYFATVYIGDEVPNYSGFLSSTWTVTRAYPPAPPGFSNISTGGFTAAFSTGNAAGTEYELEASTSPDYIPAVSSGWLSSASAGFSGLEPNTTYYARARAKNSLGAATAYSDGAVFLPQFPGTHDPKKPLAEGSYSGGTFTLLWQAVTEDILGGTITIKSYDIYQSSVVGGTALFTASVSSSVLGWSASVGAVKLYSVKAVDEYNNAGEASAWIQNTNGTAMTISDDKKAYIEIPKAVNDALKLANLVPVMLEQPAQESASMPASYKVYFTDEHNNIVLNRAFPGNVTLAMLIAKNLSFGPSSVYDYAVFYENGVEEVNLGGLIDPLDGAISVNTGRTGSFNVRQVARPQAFRITHTVPGKIFTPNGDGVWDEFNIIYDNPQALVISEARIYDLAGAGVANLKAGGPICANSLYWDGKRSAGGKAPGSVYIYQFKAGDKYYNGTIVLAR